MTSNHRTSYCKTLVLAAVAGSVAAVAGWLLWRLSWGMVSALLSAVGWMIAVAFFAVALSGVVVLLRDSHQRRFRTNLFQSLNRIRSEASVAQGGADAGLWLRRFIRTCSLTRGFVVGEVVEVKSYDEICKTLDAQGCVSALPFMPEMRKFCGRRARIFRRVDKIYDYGRSKKLRRLDDAYLLSYMRCDGSAHGGCQAGCYLLWKRDWLKPVESEASADMISEVGQSGVAKQGIEANAETKYQCQFTQLVAASTSLPSWDPRPDIRPLLSGNVTLSAFVLAMFTRLFNYVQGRRGGIGYPATASSPLVSPPVAQGRLEPGARVRVLEPDQIAATLDKVGRNRGLWFDHEMLKYCGQSCVVRKRVDRIIDDATGLMRIMKSPCLVLHDVDYSGETLRFTAQEEHMYWREVWVSPLELPDTHAGSGSNAWLQTAAKLFPEKQS